MHGQADASRVLGDAGASLQSVVDALDAVLLHREEEARRELGSRGTSIEQGRRRVREVFLRHELVGLDRGINIRTVNTNGHAHDHVLRPLRDLAVAAHQVGSLQRLEAEVVVLEVAVVDDRAVDLVLVRPAAVSRDGGGFA